MSQSHPLPTSWKVLNPKWGARPRVTTSCDGSDRCVDGPNGKTFEVWLTDDDD